MNRSFYLQTPPPKGSFCRKLFNQRQTLNSVRYWRCAFFYSFLLFPFRMLIGIGFENCALRSRQVLPTALFGKWNRLSSLTSVLHEPIERHTPRGHLLEAGPEEKKPSSLLQFENWFEQNSVQNSNIALQTQAVVFASSTKSQTSCVCVCECLFICVFVWLFVYIVCYLSVLVRLFIHACACVYLYYCVLCA